VDKESSHYEERLDFSTDSRLRNIFLGYSTEDRLPTIAPEKVSGFDGRPLERPRCKWDNSKNGSSTSRMGGWWTISIWLRIGTSCRLL